MDDVVVDLESIAAPIEVGQLLTGTSFEIAVVGVRLGHIVVPRQQGMVGGQDDIVDVVDAIGQAMVSSMAVSVPNIVIVAVVVNHGTFERVCKAVCFLFR